MQATFTTAVPPYDDGQDYLIYSAEEGWFIAAWHNGSWAEWKKGDWQPVDPKSWGMYEVFDMSTVLPEEDKKVGFIGNLVLNLRACLTRVFCRNKQ